MGRQLLKTYGRLAKADQTNMFGESPGSKGIEDQLKFTLTETNPDKYIAELKGLINGCTRCSLGKAAREKNDQSVLSRGSTKAQVMVVAEAPAREELVMGVPLCGPSGKVWHGMLADAGIDAENKLYQTNSLMCRVNKTDTSRLKEQLHACAPYVEHQLYVIKPRFLLALGKTAMDRLGVPAGQSPLDEDLTIFHYQKIPGTWIAHPAYILRNMESRPTYVDKLIRLKKYLLDTYNIDLSLPKVVEELEEL